MSRTVFAVLALSAAMTAGAAAPASAEFFGCNERSSSRTYTTPAPRSSRAATQDYSAPSRTRYTYFRAGETHYAKATSSDRSR